MECVAIHDHGGNNNRPGRASYFFDVGEIWLGAAADLRVACELGLGSGEYSRGQFYRQQQPLPFFDRLMTHIQATSSSA
jgi:hypothetical protein